MLNDIDRSKLQRPRLRQPVLIAAVVVVPILLGACGASHSSQSQAPSSATPSAQLPEASTAEPCAAPDELEPLISDADGTSEDGPTGAVTAAVLASATGQAGNDQAAGFSTLAGADLLRHSLWTYTPTSQPTDFADDGESGVSDDGGVAYQAFAARLLLGDQLVDRTTGQVDVSYDATPVAIASDCRAAVISDGSLHVLDSSGNQVWQIDAESSNSTRAQFVGSDGSLLFVGDPSSVSVYDASSGVPKWSLPTGGSGYGVEGSDVVLTSAYGTTYYDAATGTKELAVSSSGGTALSSVSLSCTGHVERSLGNCQVVSLDGVQTALTGADESNVAAAWDVGSNDGFIIANTTDHLSYFATPTSKGPAWTAAGPAGQLPTNFDGQPWPVTGGEVVMAFGDSRSAASVLSISLATGAVSWTKSLTSSDGTPSLWIDGSANQVIAYPDEYIGAGNPTEGLDLATGLTAWTSPDTVVGLNQSITPLVTQGNILGLDTATGQVSWTVTRPEGTS